MATLSDLVQALPQELYDEIYDLTFTKTTDVIHVNKAYRPPSSLHVDWESRAYWQSILLQYIATVLHAVI